MFPYHCSHQSYMPDPPYRNGLPTGVLIIHNIPYSISTDGLRKWFTNKQRIVWIKVERSDWLELQEWAKAYIRFDGDEEAKEALRTFSPPSVSTTPKIYPLLF